MADRPPMIDGPVVHWSDTDLTDSLAFMRAVPKPYLDGLYGIRESDAARTYMETFAEDIHAMFGEYLDTSRRVRPRTYQVPPDAGPDTDFIFTILENFDAVVQTLETYLSLGGQIIQFVALRKRHDDEVDNRFDSTYSGGMYMSIRAMEAMCLHHAHSTYYRTGDRRHIQLKSYSRSVHIGAVDHPAPSVQYTVTVSIGRDTYVYVTQANGEVLEHFKIEKGEPIGLPRPNWLDPEGGYLGDQVTILPDRTYPDE